MITALEIVTGLQLTLTLATSVTARSTWQLGRMVGRDGEQREVKDAGAGALQFQKRCLTARAFSRAKCRDRGHVHDLRQAAG
jgi:hypothetical protein